MAGLESEECTATVTPVGITLTVRTLTDAYFTLAIPPYVGERLAQDIWRGLEQTAGLHESRMPWA
jgi:hypothetical protein